MTLSLSSLEQNFTSRQEVRKFPCDIGSLINFLGVFEQPQYVKKEKYEKCAEITSDIFEIGRRVKKVYFITY